jgi:hypothetical protein
MCSEARAENSSITAEAQVFRNDSRITAQAQVFRNDSRITVQAHVFRNESIITTVQKRLHVVNIVAQHIRETTKRSQCV